MWFCCLDLRKMCCAIFASPSHDGVIAASVASSETNLAGFLWTWEPGGIYVVLAKDIEIFFDDRISSTVQRLFLWSAVFSVDLLVSGSIHQGDERFSVVSRGRQCAFISLSALLCANSCHPSQWTTQMIDYILIQGDSMYLTAYEEHTIPDTETISLTYLPDLARWFPLDIRTEQSPVEANNLNQSPVIPSNNTTDYYVVFHGE